MGDAHPTVLPPLPFPASLGIHGYTQLCSFDQPHAEGRAEALQTGARGKKDRTLFEHLAYACLVENSPHDVAEQVFNTFRADYFDWNEVRVSTLRELTEVTKPLVDPPEAVARLKQTLHSVFEGVYQFDLETLKKQNIGQSAKQLVKAQGQLAICRRLRDPGLARADTRSP